MSYKGIKYFYRADSRVAPSKWETALLRNAVSHLLGANQESALYSYVHLNLTSIKLRCIHTTETRFTVMNNNFDASL